jgi:uncharacterized protein YbjT (DUF2867 family)
MTTKISSTTTASMQMRTTNAAAADAANTGSGGRGQATLILGGTGKTGRRIAARLTAKGRAVRIGSRSGQPAFDWEQPATWGPALADVEAVYISYYPDIAVPGAPEKIKAFTDMALQHGVRRLVLLSGRGETEAQHAEQMLIDSGADWTILRCSWFSQNFNEGAFLDAVLSGEVALPVGDIPEPFVDTDDIADVAVAALTEPGHVGKLYEMTGPRLLTFADAIAEIARAANRPIRFVKVTADEYIAAMVEMQMPEEVVKLVAYLFTEVLDGRNAHLADGVQQALGRAPRDFADYARDAAATGVWNAIRSARS